MAKAKSMVDAQMIRELAALLAETGLTEIEFEQGGMRVKVSRAGSGINVQLPVQSAALLGTPAPSPAAESGPVASAPLDPASHPGVVKSPMVGTVYRAPAPGAAPFVEAGTEVKQGQTVLIIEAMKTMNQILAPRSGRVVEVMVADSQPVEYGEPLLIIE